MASEKAIVAYRSDLVPDLVIPSPATIETRDPHTTRREAPAPQHRTLADLLAEVIGRGASDRTRLAYRGDLEDFLSWLLGGEITLPADPSAARRPGTH
ncbi:MAG: hypothetical protein U0232_27795 [Thermomicrobiales bacterium]